MNGAPLMSRIALADPFSEPSDADWDTITRAALATALTRRDLADTRFLDAMKVRVDLATRGAGLPGSRFAAARLRPGQGQRPTLAVVAGPDGAGKTTLAAQRVRHRLRTGRSMTFETSLCSRGELDLLQRASAAGCRVHLVYVCTAGPRINAARVAARVIKGGRAVPIREIVECFIDSVANAAAAARFVDRFELLDNSIEGSPIRTIFRAAHGHVVADLEPAPHAVAAILRITLQRRSPSA